MVDQDGVTAFARAVGHALRMERQRRRWTLRRTGKLLGLSESVICRMELGGHPLDMTRFAGLCAVLDVPPARVIADAQRKAFPSRWPDDPVSDHQHPSDVSALSPTLLLAGGDWAVVLTEEGPIRSERELEGEDTAKSGNEDQQDDHSTTVDAHRDSDPLSGAPRNDQSFRPRMTDTAVLVLAVMLTDPEIERSVNQIAQAAGMQPDRVRRALDQFFRAGWTSEHPDASDPSRKYPPTQRYYQLTPKGVIAARVALDEAGVYLPQP